MSFATAQLSLTPQPPAGTIKLWVTTAVAVDQPPRPRWVSTELLHATATVTVPCTPGQLWLKVTAVRTDPTTGVTHVVGTAVLERCAEASAEATAPLTHMREGTSQGSRAALGVARQRLRITLPKSSPAGLRACAVDAEATGFGDGQCTIETAWPVPTTMEMGWPLLGVNVYAGASAQAFQSGLLAYFYRGVVLLAAGQTRGMVATLAVVQRLQAAVNADAASGRTTALDALLGAMLQGAGGDYHSETEDDRGSTLLTFGTNADCDDFACSAVLLANALLAQWPRHAALGAVEWPEMTPAQAELHQATVALMVQTCNHLCRTFREACVVYGISKSPSKPEAGRFGHAWAALMRKCPAKTYNLAGALHLECTAPITTGKIPGLPGISSASVVREQVAMAKQQRCGGAKQALYAGTRVADDAAMREFYPVFFRAIFADATVVPANGEPGWQDVRCGRVMMKTMSGAPDTVALALRRALYHRAGFDMLPSALPTGVTALPRFIGAAWAVAPNSPPGKPGDVEVRWDSHHVHRIRPSLRPPG